MLAAEHFMQGASLNEDDGYRDRSSHATAPRSRLHPCKGNMTPARKRSIRVLGRFKITEKLDFESLQVVSQTHASNDLRTGQHNDARDDICKRCTLGWVQDGQEVDKRAINAIHTYHTSLR
jgi:hypothetical protein